MKIVKKLLWGGVGLATMLGGSTATTVLAAATHNNAIFAKPSSAQATLTQRDIAATLTDYARSNQFPNKLEFSPQKGSGSVVGRVRYTFDQEVHDKMADVYLRYQPDYACFVAIDVDSGAILNLTSFIKSDEDWDNLVMRSDYPAAAVFKMVTAAAGLDSGKLLPSTIIPFNGKSTTLYKNQVLGHRTTKWTRNPTLKESFAKSMNPVFAQIGVFQLGAERLLDYARRFGFDRRLDSDFMLPLSHVGLDFDTRWEIAEAASGYTRDITLSPIHAAQMAAIVANDGRMVTPYMVESVVGMRGELLYEATADKKVEKVISVSAARQMRGLMRETTRIGSARRSFSGLHRYKVYKNMEIGGKTGSLTGLSPKGRHDWFVGYAEKEGRRVAYASLIINKEKWYVRSAYVARQFIYHYFSQPETPLEVAKSQW
ncbi:MAG: hypothetical protein HKN85_03310 [Gammaproteobacteria bacterium]|nr:hypothetical protein [Gammaproteobacteria bacterium]